MWSQESTFPNCWGNCPYWGSFPELAAGFAELRCPPGAWLFLAYPSDPVVPPDRFVRLNLFPLIPVRLRPVRPVLRPNYRKLIPRTIKLFSLTYSRRPPIAYLATKRAKPSLGAQHSGNYPEEAVNGLSWNPKENYFLYWVGCGPFSSVGRSQIQPWRV